MSDDIVSQIEEFVKIGKINRTKDRTFITIKNSAPEIRKALIPLLKAGARLSVITALDNGKDLEMLYHFSVKKEVITIRVEIPKSKPEVISITPEFPAAVLYEREAMDMIGVKVLEHPDPRKLLLPEDMQEHPLRRDK
jgi:Ni,Fe-hydrogenase III component G